MGERVPAILDGTPSGGITSRAGNGASKVLTRTVVACQQARRLGSRGIEVHRVDYALEPAGVHRQWRRASKELTVVT